MNLEGSTAAAAAAADMRWFPLATSITPSTLWYISYTGRGSLEQPILSSQIANNRYRENIKL